MKGVFALGPSLYWCRLYTPVTKHCIRIVTPEGEVPTYAGKNTSGTADGIASQVEFNNPEGCRFGADGVLHIADYSNNRIRKIEEKAGK